MTTQEPANVPMNAYQDLMTVLEQRPELRAPLADYLIPPELLKLPAVVEEIRESQKRMEARQDRMELEIAQIKESQGRMEARQDRMELEIAQIKESQGRMEARQDRMELEIAQIKESQGRMETRQERMEAKQDWMETTLNQTVKDLNDLKGMVTGSQYEAKAVRNLETAARAAGLRRLKLLLAGNMPNDQELMEKLEDAVDQNLITGTEADAIRNADAIAQARDRHTHDWVYLVAEASVTVHPSDVYRAVRRARLLRQATGNRTIPAVLGDQISDDARQLAGQDNAVIVRLSL